MAWFSQGRASTPRWGAIIACLPCSVAGTRAWERRFRDLIAYHVADLGGEAETSIGEREIIRSICAQTVEMELLEKRFALKGDGASKPPASRASTARTRKSRAADCMSRLPTKTMTSALGGDSLLEAKGFVAQVCRKVDLPFKA